MGTAYLLRVLPLDETASSLIPHTASLYRVDPPLHSTPTRGYDHVIVLAQEDQYGEQTLILGADPDARITSLGDLPGSFDGAMDHVEALRRAGYEVVISGGPDHG